MSASTENIRYELRKRKQTAADKVLRSDDGRSRGRQLDSLDLKPFHGSEIDFSELI